MKTLVMKFGGSSLASIDHIKAVANVVVERSVSVDKIVLVVSAMGKMTDDFLNRASEISANPTRREMDVLLSTGEQMSSAYLTMALCSLGKKALSLSGSQAGIITYGTHSKAKISAIQLERIRSEFVNHDIIVVAGFQGTNEKGDITTLGRGGSDTSAVALGCVLGCPVEIYTDVEGIYTVDPRLFPSARKLVSLSYEETMEMANLGASIIEPRSVELASRFGVEIDIRINTADKPGTRIEGSTTLLEENIITNVSLMKDIVLITIEKSDINAATLFTLLAQAGISVDVISQTFHKELSFSIMKADCATALEIIETVQTLIYHVKDDVSKVSIIGNAMRNQSGVAAKIFAVFAQNDIYFHQVSTSEISISYIIDSIDTEIIIKALAKAFDL